MKKHKKKKKIGLPPGTLEFTGDHKIQDSIVQYLEYNTENVRSETYDSRSFRKVEKPDESMVQWYDIRGLHDLELIQKIGDTFGVHSLVLEDVVDINQRPKYEEFQEGIFITLKAISFDADSLELEMESLSLFFGHQYLISFQEKELDQFQQIKERILEGRGTIRTRGADYLAYALVDVTIDNYFYVFDHIETVISELETLLLANPEKIQKEVIHHSKLKLIELKKAIAPLREAVNQFSRAENTYINPRTGKYVRDTYDHILQIIESVDTYKDTLSGLQDLYISEISFRMNKVMQFLAVITTIFVPITFLAGVYGMNFKYIPELEYANGYFILLGVMAVVILLLIYFFKKKRWI